MQRKTTNDKDKVCCLQSFIHKRTYIQFEYRLNYCEVNFLVMVWYGQQTKVVLVSVVLYTMKDKSPCKSVYICCGDESRFVGIIKLFLVISGELK